MSEQTRALEDQAVDSLMTLLYGALRAQTEERTEAHEFYGALLDALVAKFKDNLEGELASIRRLTDANPGESTYKAVKRLRDSLRGVLAKYRAAQQEWKRLDDLRDNVRLVAGDQRDAEAANLARGFELGVRHVIAWLRSDSMRCARQVALTLDHAAENIEFEILKGHDGPPPPERWGLLHKSGFWSGPREGEADEPDPDYGVKSVRAVFQTHADAECALPKRQGSEDYKPAPLPPPQRPFPLKD